jgi:Rad3-related DNA helicase
MPLNKLTFFGELMSSYQKGFKIIFQPNPMDGGIADPLLTLACLDSSLAMAAVWKGFPCVVLTSGTISPL